MVGVYGLECSSDLPSLKPVQRGGSFIEACLDLRLVTVDGDEIKLRGLELHQLFSELDQELQPALDRMGALLLKEADQSSPTEPAAQEEPLGELEEVPECAASESDYHEQYALEDHPEVGLTGADHMVLREGRLRCGAGGRSGAGECGGWSPPGREGYSP